MSNRKLAKGMIVEGDLAGGTTFAAIGGLLSAKPPDSESTEVDLSGINDTREIFEHGIKKATEFSFIAFWEQGSSLYENLLTCQNANTEANWRVKFPFSTVKTQTFKGKITKLGHPDYTNKEGIRCLVTVRTTEEPAMA